MADKRMKKVLILKNFDSKYIDQAIIFLRNDNIRKNAEKVDQNYIVNEAIKVVNQYVERNYFSSKKKLDKEKNKKIGKVLNISLFLAIILLISLLTRAFLF